MLMCDAEFGFFSVKFLGSVLMLGGHTESGFFSVKFLDSVLILGGHTESGFFSVKFLDSVLMLGGHTESGFVSVKFLDSVLMLGGHTESGFFSVKFLDSFLILGGHTESGFFSVKFLDSVLMLGGDIQNLVSSLCLDSVGDTKSRFLSVKVFGFCSQVKVKWNLVSSMMILGSVLRLGGDKEVRLFSGFLGFISEVKWEYRMFLFFSL